jgi:hypothetical protein
VLADLRALAAQHAGLDHPHALSVLRTMSAGRGSVERSLDELAARGWARQPSPGLWVLTPAGREEADRIGTENESSQ